jgi:methyl-accepting chemotaxis protein
MTDLRAFQLTVAKVLAALGVAHVPMLAAICFLLGGNVMANTVAAAALAAVPLALLYAGRPIETVAFAIAVTLVGQTSLLVLAFEGHPWQVEMHFYYFAVLAMLSGFCDWRVLVVAAGLVSVHHLTLNYVLPTAIYPGGTNLLRVTVHAIVVVIEVAILIFVGHTIRRAFAAADQARNAAEAAAAELAAIGKQREQTLVATNRRADLTGTLLDKFKAEMENSIAILSHAAHELEDNADGLDAAADQAKSQVAAAQVASGETTAKVATVADAGNELARTIYEIGATVAESSRLTSETVESADVANQAITELTAAASEIGDMTSLINRIAAQTNLLALNATIEAARAGAAGKGFAIVAQEVKALAAETAKATEDIARKTDGIQGTTERSAAAIAAISTMVRELDRLSARIGGAIESQAAATHEISQNVDAAASGVGDVAGAIVDIAAVVDQTAHATKGLRHSAVELAVQTKTIRERIMSFSDSVRTAQA